MRRETLLLLACCMACVSTGQVQLGPTPQETGETAEPPPPEPLGLCINEFVARGEESWLDDSQRGTDWIELHHPGPEALSLDGYFLTDDPEMPFKHALPAHWEIEAGGFVVFAADDVPSLGPQHLSFALAAEGEYLGLFRADGTGEVLRYGRTEVDHAWARQPDCCADVATCMTQVFGGTPDASNVETR